jgi:hypothetical protein
VVCHQTDAAAGKLLSRLKSGSMLLADRGYDADWIRELAMKKGAWANIPPKSNRSDPICFSPYFYRARKSAAPKPLPFALFETRHINF